MRRTSVALVVLLTGVFVPANAAWAARRVVPPPTVPPPTGGGSSGSGVPPGTPVFVRLSPDNNVINAVTTAAARVGLGPVSVDRFRADCSPIQDQVVVCRDINLTQSGQRSATAVGPGWCVVSLDPRVGGAPVGVNHVTRAMKKCLVKRGAGTLPGLPFGSEV